MYSDLHFYHFTSAVKKFSQKKKWKFIKSPNIQADFMTQTNIKQSSCWSGFTGRNSAESWSWFRHTAQLCVMEEWGRPASPPCWKQILQETRFQAFFIPASRQEARWVSTLSTRGESLLEFLRGGKTEDGGYDSRLHRNRQESWNKGTSQETV